MIMVLAPHRAVKASATAAKAGSPREREAGAPEPPPVETAGPAGTAGE